MTIRERSAIALDMTHGLTMLGTRTIEVRNLLAAYLDGRKFKATTVRKLCSYLEMIARSGQHH